MFITPLKAGFFNCMKQTITITTDFKDSFATSQLKAVAYSLGFDGPLIENHDVSPFSTLEGAYGIWQLAKFCPLGTIHVGVVDPGVGSDRSGIVIKTQDFWFVGPDNGLLYPAALANKIMSFWKIDEKYFGEVSKTFHGRDVFIKSAVLLAGGKQPEGFGCKRIHKIEELKFNDGQVVHIDRYGNAKVWGEKTFGLPVIETFSDVPEGTPHILNGSSDILEIAVNLGSAKDCFGLKLGQVIKHL